MTRVNCGKNRVMNTHNEDLKPLSLRITDARGRSMSMIDPISQYTLHRQGAIDSETLGRIAEGIEPGVRQRVRWAVPFGIGVMAITLAVVLVSVIAEGKPAWDDLKRMLTSPAFIPIIGYMLFVLPWIMIAAKRKRRMKTYAAMLKHRHCPHCGYSLKGLPVDPMDGATLCPECSGAWKLDDPAIDAACGIESSTACAARPGKGMMIAMALLTFGALAGVFVFFLATR